ncbi:hypothetical protein MU1_04080 [Paenibacillus glycanilyticus]|uniref:Glycosyl hydrolase family 32 C-terminal domain-containing protein n=1 Tax=Paenibacillus glycanilyticus TaxID=126569 RepID=A0ABQ6G537_9BACL|nr:hypothetical protein MU1_04080 [Paenibacillus glycanilyticus]
MRLDWTANTIVIDRSESSLFPGVHKSSVEGKLPAGEGGERLRLRIFADQSIVEVFADDETCLTARVYPSLEDSNGIRSSETIVQQVEIWEMNAAEMVQ